MMVDFFLVTCNMWHLLALNCILHFRAHDYKVPMSFCSDKQSASDLIWWNSSASSANNVMVPDMFILLSFIDNKKKHEGPEHSALGYARNYGYLL